jgi:antitoxin (DNA-binding transcriptional repressor) of toxin-antitoxin stability system
LTIAQIVATVAIVATEFVMGVLSVRELNANISKALSRVEAGEVLDISRNGKVIAELRPKTPVRDAAWQKAYEENVALLRSGLSLGIGKVTPEDKYGDVA